MLWWTNKCHWLGIGRQLRAGSTHFLWAVAAGTRESFFSPVRGGAGRGRAAGGGNQFGRVPAKFNSIVDTRSHFVYRANYL